MPKKKENLTPKQPTLSDNHMDQYSKSTPKQRWQWLTKATAFARKLSKK